MRWVVLAPIEINSQSLERQLLLDAGRGNDVFDGERLRGIRHGWVGTESPARSYSLIDPTASATGVCVLMFALRDEDRNRPVREGPSGY